MILSPKLCEWIQAPGSALPDQTKNGREIVGEDDGTESAAIDQPGSSEDLPFLLNDDLSALCGVSWDGVWVLPCSTLIDLQELLGDVLETANGR